MQSARFCAVSAMKLLNRGGGLPQIRHCRSSHGGHHPPFGPPVTYDYMPVPCKPHGLVYRNLQKKFDIFLGASVVFLVFSMGVCIYTDAFSAKCFKNTQSYIDQKKAGK
uniref:Deltamethrin resistance protein prag01 domain-containing protein n=1 Tax=Ditylenchus dipsaci TaxID=166011 RepID=A0A915DD34_9BILA